MMMWEIVVILTTSTRQTGVTDMTKIKIIKVRESYGYDYYVYAGNKLLRVCPSIDMANAVAAANS